MNFGLRVVGRRADGYHELESLFLPLDLADELGIEVEPAPALRIALAVDPPGGHVPGGDENLAVRAARAFLERAGLSLSVRLRLSKRIPAAAGLGGGSSDAAAVLRGLAALNPGALADEELAGLAAGLGADVPFFLESGPRFVSGIGERLEPPPRPWPSLLLVLANPGEGLSTAAVFREFAAREQGGRASEPGAAALTGGPGPSNLRSLLEAVEPDPSDPAPLQALLTNDLEPAAVRLCPAVATLRDALWEAGAGAVAMSGSGATVFGVFGGEAAARSAAEQVAASGAWARVARTRESE